MKAISQTTADAIQCPHPIIFNTGVKGVFTVFVIKSICRITTNANTMYIAIENKITALNNKRGVFAVGWNANIVVTNVDGEGFIASSLQFFPAPLHISIHSIILQLVMGVVLSLFQTVESLKLFAQSHHLHLKVSK